MTNFSSILIGNENLLIGCAQQLLDHGHTIRAIVTDDKDILSWAHSAEIQTLPEIAEIEQQFNKGEFDWLFSIANLKVIDQSVLDLPARGGINFHDGPLPEYAGLNTPVWALLEGRNEHGITWHLIEGGIDEGNILEQRRFPISEHETAFSLNSKCFAAALDAFGSLVVKLTEPTVLGTAQNLSQRQYYAGSKRPQAGGEIDFLTGAYQIGRTVRALDFNGYWNSMSCPKIRLGSQWVVVGKATESDEDSTAEPGTIVINDGSELTCATSDKNIVLSDLRDTNGGPLNVALLAEEGSRIESLSENARHDTEEGLRKVARHELYWRKQLSKMQNFSLPLAAKPGKSPDWQKVVVACDAMLSRNDKLTIASLWAMQNSGEGHGTLAYCPTATPGQLCEWVPVDIHSDLNKPLDAFADSLRKEFEGAREKGAFALDLIARAPELSDLVTPDFAVSNGYAPLKGSCATVSLADGPNLEVWLDHQRLGDDAIRLLSMRLETLVQKVRADNGVDMAALLSMPESEQEIVDAWNAATTMPFDETQTIHGAFEAQVAKSPDDLALVFQDVKLTYKELNARANRVAHQLRSMGAGTGQSVGLYTKRSPDLLIGVLGILKAGAAYVPLDPAYPADRITHYIQDSGTEIIVTQSELSRSLPVVSAQILELDRSNQFEARPDTNPHETASGSDVAYLIYTSGSTGVPKGVQVEHRNVSNFFVGMDASVDADKGTVWLAVTSLSFDISVLELFYTLARGFKVVLADENTHEVSRSKIAVSDRHIDFGLFYWGNDGGIGPKKYELLLDGARFAQANGFNSVWTPERHFHAFGGPYPNPSVSGAAVAAVAPNLSVRSGSCVAPLHHPARIAEEWAMIDNLTNGRAGIGFASGWQPDDFVLRPENTPPNNKAAMYETIEQVRKLWRGEEVEFPTKSGEMFPVLTQPRPVSKELPVWVTTAGNPDTWREAGELGANVLTHLLGQSIDEVGEKIKIYHAALQEAGHDPNDFKVTVMLHTFLAEDREIADKTAREPLKDYLRSAAGLIKQYAWAFPAFKRPEGVNNPFEMDLRDLAPEEVEAILDFAFERYFEESGMFGTVEDGIARAEQLKRIGVDEIACLIDYGIPAETVLEGLKPLAEVLKRANAATELDDDDFSVASQIIRHGVTHLQCTPSMARIISMNDEARVALSHVHQLLLGGEVLPAELVDNLRGCTNAEIHNMYGPTETTVWSTTHRVCDMLSGTVSIGTPIANTSIHVLDENGKRVPIGVAGELFIGGAGVTRGYWQRDDLNKELFPADPFAKEGRMYRTGDLVRWTPSGQLEFLGRADHQVKIRGQRIELGEIETAMAEVPGVRQAIVILREDNPGAQRLVGYFTQHSPVNEDALRNHLNDRLPAAMVPAHFMVLDAFPMTPNRKVDRNALPEPASRRSAPVVNIAAVPASSTEKAIAAIWARVLGQTDIQSNDNFFDLGGHSLLAVQTHREIKSSLGVDTIAITDIFRFPILADLARHISGNEPEQDAEAANAGQSIRTATMSKRRAMRAEREKR